MEEEIIGLLKTPPAGAFLVGGHNFLILYSDGDNLKVSR